MEGWSSGLAQAPFLVWFTSIWASCHGCLVVIGFHSQVIMLHLIIQFLFAHPRVLFSPDKPTFYRYCFALFVLNLVQAIGSALYRNHEIIGMCVVDVTVYLYFTTFTPLVYWSFLASFFSYTKSLMFSYKPQLDDGLDDNIITPGVISNPISHQLSCSSIRTDGSDLVYQPKLIDSNAQDIRVGDVRLSFYESSLSPDSIRSASVNSWWLDTTNHGIAWKNIPSCLLLENNFITKLHFLNSFVVSICGGVWMCCQRTDLFDGSGLYNSLSRTTFIFCYQWVKSFETSIVHKSAKIWCCRGDERGLKLH